MLDELGLDPKETEYEVEVKITPEPITRTIKVTAPNEAAARDMVECDEDGCVSNEYAAGDFEEFDAEILGVESD